MPTLGAALVGGVAFGSLSGPLPLFVPQPLGVGPSGAAAALVELGGHACRATGRVRHTAWCVPAVRPKTMAMSRTAQARGARRHARP